jgi:hypothetical protein
MTHPDTPSGGPWFDACPFGVLAVTDGTVTAANDAATRLLDTTDPVGDAIEAVFPAAVDRRVADVFDDGDPTASQAFEEFYPTLDQWLAVTIEPVSTGAAVYIQAVTDRVAAERQVDEMTGRLDRVATISELLSTVLSQLVDASTRAEIAETICDRLGDVERYAFAWFGERDPATDELAIRAVTGEPGETFSRIREHVETGPERHAMDTGTIEIVESLAEDERVPTPVRRAAFADGIQSSLAVPLVYGETAYGVVGVYATQRDAFSPRARASFETLGTVAGFAVDAIRNREVLSADAVTAFTFELTGADAPLAAVTAAIDATLTVDGTVPPDRDQLTCYLNVEGAAPTATADALRTKSAVGTTRVLTDHGTAGRLEVELGAQTPLHTVVSLGATIGNGRFEEGRGRITAELPSSSEYDVRRLAETLQRQFAVDAVSTVRHERSPTTAEQLRTELDDRLTARQTDALRTAYLAGYFESPRDSTAEEVGAALGITGSTLLHHLRAGQRKLLDAYLDVDPGADPTTGVDTTRVGSGAGRGEGDSG